MTRGGVTVSACLSASASETRVLLAARVSEVGPVRASTPDAVRHRVCNAAAVSVAVCSHERCTTVPTTELWAAPPDGEKAS